MGVSFLPLNTLSLTISYLVLESDTLKNAMCREFVGCVRCIRILSPTEVQQMSEEGMKLLNSGALQGMNV